MLRTTDRRRRAGLDWVPGALFCRKTRESVLKLHTMPGMRGILAVTAATTLALITAPSGHTDSTYGPGTHVVPAQLPYDVYVAHNQPGAYPGCMFTTYIDEGKIIDASNGTLQNSLTAEIPRFPDHRDAETTLGTSTLWTVHPVSSHSPARRDLRSVDDSTAIKVSFDSMGSMR